jgi:hypothetical protein
MTNINIKQGDIGETDEENDKLIEKMEKRAARKITKQPKNDRQNKLAHVELLGKPDTLVSYTERPATNAEETKKVTTTNTNQKAQKASARTTTKKEVKPQYISKDLNVRGKTLISPHLVERVFALKNEGVKNPQIAEQLNISQGSVSTILSGPEWFRNRMVAYGQKEDPNWTYPQRTEKPTEGKGN